MSDENLFEKMIEMGVGLTLVNQIPKIVQPHGSGSNTQTPPPAPDGLQLFVDGNQVGPLTESEMNMLIQNNRVTSDTLVWKTGLSCWVPANQLPEVGKMLILNTIKNK